MIRSGSHTPGVDPDDFGLPPGTALRYEQPARALRALLPSYAVLDSDGNIQSGPGNWVLPGWAKLWIVLAPDPPGVTLRHRNYAVLGSAMLFGVTSRAMPFSTNGGVSVVVEIGPLAWARLFAPSAALLRDRVVPLAELVPSGWSEDLVACVARSDRGAQVKTVLDDFFLERMSIPHPQEAQITSIAALLVDESTRDLSNAATQVGIEKRALWRLTKRYFGFPPKTLSMRTRFLRALTTMMLDTDTLDFSTVPLAYHDVSHFIRDANHFLGLTPRRFVAMAMPYTRAALRARMLVIGSPASSLDKPASQGPNLSSGIAPSA